MADKKISALTAAATPLAGTEVLPIVQSGSTVKVSIANVTAGRNIAANALIMDLGTTGPAYVQAKNTSVDSYFAVANYSLWATGYNDSPSLQIGTATNHPIVIGVNNVGVAKFGANDFSLFNGNLVIGTAGKGIDFSANTHAAGMTSELLNWYEEGTWTATVTAESGTITTYTTEASYTRVGKIVSVRLAIRLANVGSASGALIFTGLPFATRNYTDNYPASTFLVRETWVSGDAYQGFIADNSSTGYIVNMTGDAINWSNDAVYVFEATYMCA